MEETSVSSNIEFEDSDYDEHWKWDVEQEYDNLVIVEKRKENEKATKIENSERFKVPSINVD